MYVTWYVFESVWPNYIYDELEVIYIKVEYN